MLPALQPSRPKPSQQRPQPSYAQQQQRAIHEVPRTTPKPTSNVSSVPKPRSQLEAMPPFTPAQAPFFPPQSVYDSAVRHPVFFTAQLRKPPFPVPQIATHGWSPVASGYIMEARKAEAHGVARTKL